MGTIDWSATGLFGKVILQKYCAEFCRETENAQVAYVTFKDSQGADTAMLLTVC